MEAFNSVPNSLPHKEATLIRQAQKNLKAKQNPKALKQIDKVLEKFPDHGDTLAFKSFVLSALNRRDEALDTAKYGLMKNLKGCLSWYALSLIYNNENNFVEAMKTTQRAYSLDPSNSFVSRNLSFLQIQLREYEQFRDGRRAVMLKNPSVILNWVSYFVGEYLSGDLQQSVNTLNAFQKSMS